MISTLLKTIRSFGWNTRLLRGIALSVLLYRAVIAAAQDERPEIEPLYSYHFNGIERQEWEYQGAYYPYGYEWTPDNVLVMKDMILHLESKDEHREVWTWLPVSIIYNPDGPGALQSLTPPAPPTPLPSHVQMLPPTFNTPFATSPDGRVDLYTVDYSVPSEDYTTGYRPSYHVLGLLDRTTGDVAVLPDVRLLGNVADIHWSADGNALVMRIYGFYGSVFYAYISGFDDITKTRGLMLMNSGPFADTLQWSIYQVYDLDSTGRYLLADGYLYSPESDPGNMRLLMIDMQTLTYEVISSKGYFNGAGFQKPDEQQVLYMSKDGIFAYDRQTKTSVLLTDAINATYTPSGDFLLFHPDFSPNGRYLVTQLTADENYRENLYVYPIPPIPEDK